MLKAIQILGSSSGFVSHRWRPHNSGGLSFISISTKPSSSSSSSSSRRPTASMFLPDFSTRKTRCFRAFRVSATSSESNPDGTSSSSSSISSHSTVVGCLIEHDNKVLLCKRKIEPSYGLWTLPAGYMEIGESAAEGAIRETWEEAGAEVEVLSPFAQLDIPLIGQTYVIFLAKLKKPQFSPGPESSECRLFAFDDIPFDSLAFSSILVTLNLYIEDVKVGRPKFHYGTINKRRGTGPSEIRAYTLDYHLQP